MGYPADVLTVIQAHVRPKTFSPFRSERSIIKFFARTSFDVHDPRGSQKNSMQESFRLIFSFFFRSLIMGENLQGLKSWARLTKFCRNFLQQAFYYMKGSAEPSCRSSRTPKVPQNSVEPLGAWASFLRTRFASSQNNKLSETPICS